jgi:hypothetical protein
MNTEDYRAITKDRLLLYAETLPLPEAFHWRMYASEPAVFEGEKLAVGWTTAGDVADGNIEVTAYLYASGKAMCFGTFTKEDLVKVEGRKAIEKSRRESLVWLSTALLLGER